jgi:TolB protein
MTAKLIVLGVILRRQVGKLTRRSGKSTLMSAKTAIVLVAVAGASALSVATSVSSAQDIDSAELGGWALQPKIAWASTRDDPAIEPLLAGEIYLMNPDLTGVERVTFTDDAGNAAPKLSPTGKRMVFESNRFRLDAPLFNQLVVTDLFLMDTVVSAKEPTDWPSREHVHIVRGASASWHPDGRRIAYHASASGEGFPLRPNPGSQTSDSDIFSLSVDEFLAGEEAPVNLTNSAAWVDDDPDYSPDGQKIAFTRHGVNDPHDNSVTAEIWVMNADGSDLTRLTFNNEEERGPAWSPDGTKIAYACRKGANPLGPTRPDGTLRPLTFEICVMNADGSGETRLTFNTTPDLTPSYSLDGSQIVFSRTVGTAQLFRMNADGSEQTQLTSASAGINLFGHQGVIKVTGLGGGDD